MMIKSICISHMGATNTNIYSINVSILPDLRNQSDLTPDRSPVVPNSDTNNYQFQMIQLNFGKVRTQV